MKKITIIGFLFLFIFLSNVSLAQEVTISDVKPNKFRGVVSIPEKGYSIFFKSEKNSKGMSTYKFHLYDLDLKPIKVNTINVSKNSLLADQEFNGTHFLFVFMDYKKKSQTQILYDVNGNEVKKKNVTLDGKRLKTYALAGKSGLEFLDILPSEDQGFYLVEMSKEKKFGYTVEKVDNKLNPVWKKNYFPKKGFAGVVAGESANGRLCILQLSMEKMMSNKMYNDLLIFDDKNGSLLGEVELTTKEHNLMPSSILIDDDGSIVLGGMYFQGLKFKQKDSDGFFTAKFSKTAKKVYVKTHAWDKGLKKKIKQGVGVAVLGSKPKLIFHEIENTGDSYQLIGETFRTAVSGAGIAANMLTKQNNGANINFTVMDYIIFNVDKNTGDLKNMQFIPKEKQRYAFDKPSLAAQGMALAYYAKLFGYFSYKFTEKNENGENTVIYYNDDNKLISKSYIGVAPIIEGKENLETKKIMLKRKSDRKGRVDAVESKKGQFLMWELDGKEKQLNLWIEKM